MRSARNGKRRLSLPLLLILGLLAVSTVLAFLLEGMGGVTSGFEGAGRLIVSAVPLALLGIGFSGMLQALISPGTMSKWMSDEKGLAGIAIAMLAGVASPGGPHITYPLARTFLNGGAGLGPTTGFVSAKEEGSLNRLFVWDLPFLGAPFSFARLIVNLLLAVAAALLVPVVYRRLPRRRHEERVSQRASEPANKSGE
jgi:uncharacterized membrane protein YraQ (UPF0718 family)